MQKKSIIAIVSAVVLMVVASLALVFTIGPKTSADTEEIPVVPVEYLNLTNDGKTLGDNSNYIRNAFNANGKAWIQNHAKYRVEIPESVTSIGYQAFYDCRGLTSITMPGSVTSIGSSAFRYCSGLTSMNYTGTLDQWVQIRFGAEYSNPTHITKKLIINGKVVTNAEISSDVTKIKPYVFYNCENLTNVTIPSSVTHIGEYAFRNCSGLTSITIPNSVTSIGDGAFCGCRGLTSITITEGVTSIGTRAFENCSGLTSITIPEGVTSIGEYVFRNCSGLNEIIVRNPGLIGNTNLTYGNSAKVYLGADQNTVSFVTNCDTTFDSRLINFGEVTTEPTTTLTKEHYTLAGWYSDEQYTKPFTFDTPIKHDIILYAKWNINRYMVDFYVQGTPVNSVFVNHGDLVAEPTISRTGYTLLGWFVDDEIDQKFNFNTPITDNIGLWAKWSINQYNVIFDSNGGNAVAPQRNVEYNTLLTVPETPTREGYNFLGWYNGDEAYDFTTPVSQDMTLTAKWESNQPDEPETPAEENPEVNNQNNAGLIWGIAGTSAGVLIIAGVTVGIVISKRRRK